MPAEGPKVEQLNCTEALSHQSFITLSVRFDLVSFSCCQRSWLMFNLLVVFESLHKLDRFLIVIGVSIRRLLHGYLFGLSLVFERNSVPIGDFCVAVLGTAFHVRTARPKRLTTVGCRSMTTKHYKPYVPTTAMITIKR
jgi:hypothetical protein